MRPGWGSCVVTLVGVATGCGEEAATVDEAGTSSGGLTDGVVADDAGLTGSIDDLPWLPLPDLPPQTKSCEERGARFGVVAGPTRVETQSSGARIERIGLGAASSGLFATYTSTDLVTGVSELLGVRLAPDGDAKGSPWALSGGSATPATYSGDDRLLLTHCTDNLVGWRAFDVSGSSLGPALLPHAYGGCGRDAPAAVWTELGYLAAWHAAPSQACPESCVALAYGRENVIFRTSSLQPTFIVTDSLTIAAAENAALVVASHVNVLDKNELAMSLVELGGEPLFPPLVHGFAAAPGPDPQVDAPVAVAATRDNGFVVFVGGRGPAYGRVRLSDIASVELAFEDVELPAELAEFDAFRSDIHATTRTGGLIVHGSVTQESDGELVEGLLLAMADDDGELQSYEFFPVAIGAAIASHEGRTWLVFGGDGLFFAELGCVL
ncbi:MAG: hypothetical protein JKY37_27675 [Nannocystaceae bacterium]|nr:hypothetical protein [Nannocystaceae bacterium]